MIIFLSTIIGIAVAWIFSTFLVNRVENRGQRINLKITIYIVFTMMGLLWGLNWFFSNSAG